MRALRGDGRGASPEAIRHHYDVGVDFYRLWLDDTLTYSCAAWDGARDLETAQLSKLDFFLTEAARGDGPLLDVGCGWGSLLARAVEHFGVTRAVGLTLSDEQAAVARSRLQGSAAEVRTESWEVHEAHERYAAIVSIGAFEHFARPGIGSAGRVARYRAFFAAAHRLLQPGGTLGLQSIAFDQATEEGDDGPLAQFLREQIFPESMLPRVPEIVAAAEPFFHLRRLACRGDDYARTCSEWRRRLVAQRAEAEQMVGPEVVHRFVRYLTGTQLGFARGDWTLVRALFTPRVRPHSIAGEIN